MTRPREPDSTLFASPWLRPSDGKGAIITHGPGDRGSGQEYRPSSQGSATGRQRRPGSDVGSGRAYRQIMDDNTRGIDIDEVRSRLGRIGVWSSAVGRVPVAAERDAVAQIESLGFGTLWITESAKEIFSHAGTVLAASTRMTVASGIANVWAREPETAVSGANALAEAYDGRFVLGVGIGHARMVARYTRPLATLRDYLDRMLAAEYQGTAPDRPVPWLVAALRPKSLDLAATRSQGSHPYFVPVEHTALAREALGPNAVLAPEVTVVLDVNPETARATARRFMADYLRLTNYTNNLLALGWTEDDFADGGTDRLVDAVVAWGNVDAIKARVDEHLAAGADHVCIQALEAAGGIAMRTLEELAPALLAAS